MVWFKILLKVLLTVVFALQLISLSALDKEIKEEDETSAATVVLFMLTYLLGFLTIGIWTVL